MTDISNIWVYSWHFLKLCFINNSKKSVYLFVCVYVWNKRFNVMLFKKRKITKNKKKKNTGQVQENAGLREYTIVYIRYVVQLYIGISIGTGCRRTKLKKNM